MGNIQTNQASTPLYKQAINSKPVQFIGEKPVLAGAGLVGSGVIIAEVASRSDLVATTIKKGAVPLVATGVAVFGASMVKDAVQNNWENAGKDFESTAKFIIKGGAGSVLAVAGLETAAQTTFGVSPIGKTVDALSRVVPDLGGTLGFAGLAAIGTTSVVLGSRNIKEQGVTIGNATAVGVGATAATAFTLAAISYFEKASPVVDKVALKSMSVVGGASLGLGAYALGKHAVNAMNEGKSGEAVLSAVGATVAGAAAVHVLGHATGIEALSNLGQKVLFKNPLLAGSITAVAMAGAGYYLYNKNDSSQAETKPEQK